MSAVPPSANATIVAVSTPPGRGAIGIVRVSGPRSRTLVGRFFRSPTPYMNRLARPGVLVDEGRAEKVIDRVVVTVFEGPGSYTGEDVAEISAHGNPHLLESIVDRLVVAGARRAEPGEFTLRAVGNGKLDLVQAEAVRDFIGAQTDRQARTAMMQMDGALSRRVRPIRDGLVALVAEIEAGIDFAEDDIAPPPAAALIRRIDPLMESVHSIAGTFREGRVLSEGLRLAIVGRPNAGKSSVFNALSGEDRAIVTPVAGTTRDVLSETVEFDGIPVRLMDTAGIRESDDAVEAIGIERARATLAAADLVVVVMDLSRSRDGSDAALLESVEGRPYVIVLNKCDLAAAWEPDVFRNACVVSATRGTGIDGLRSRIVETFGVSASSEVDGLVVTNRRQHGALVEVEESLRRARTALGEDTPHEMVALDLYSALTAMGEITGEVTTDDILDRVFSTFCIGK